MAPETRGPGRLPVVWWNGEAYFVDVRLREFRSRTGPSGGIKFVPFDSEQGAAMLGVFAVTTCRCCGGGVAGPRFQARIRCPKCRARARI